LCQQVDQGRGVQFVVSNPDYGYPCAAQGLTALFILHCFQRVIVNRPVDLYGNPQSGAVEVYDEARDDVLATKLQAQTAPASQ